MRRGKGGEATERGKGKEWKGAKGHHPSGSSSHQDSCKLSSLFQMAKSACPGCPEPASPSVWASFFPCPSVHFKPTLTVAPLQIIQVYRGKTLGPSLGELLDYSPPAVSVPRACRKSQPVCIWGQGRDIPGPKFLNICQKVSQNSRLHRATRLDPLIYVFIPAFLLLSSHKHSWASFLSLAVGYSMHAWWQGTDEQNKIQRDPGLWLKSEVCLYMCVCMHGYECRCEFRYMVALDLLSYGKVYLTGPKGKDFVLFGPEKLLKVFLFTWNQECRPGHVEDADDSSKFWILPQTCSFHLCLFLRFTFWTSLK